MIGRLAAILRIRPGEGARAGLVAALFACVQAGQGLGANAADALFLLRFGAEFLPYLYMGLGGLTFALSLAYTAGVAAPRKGRFFSVLLILSLAVLVGARASILLGHPGAYPAIWLAVNAVSALLGTMVWNVAGEVCDAREAKRLFSLFASAGILGSVLGNALTGVLARAAGAENLLLGFAVLLAAGLLLVRATARRFFPAASARKPTTSVWKDLGAGLSFVRRSRLMVLVAAASILFSILFFSVSFPFSRLVSTAFPGEAEVAGFLGAFSSLATVATFILSLLVANRLYARVGVVNTILIVPLVYLFGFALWTARFTLLEAALLRFLQLAVLGGFAGGAWNALFNVIPAERRGQVVAFQAGVPTQVGVVLSGALLLLGARVLGASQIFALGIAAAVICGGLVWRMRRAYADALLAALRAGILEVFTAVPRGMQSLAADAEAFRAALAALGDPKPEIRRAAAEILGAMGRSEAAVALEGALDDRSPEVRSAAIRALGVLGSRGPLEILRRRLSDEAPQVRAAAVDTLSALDPAPKEALRALAADPDTRTRARVAVALARIGEAAGALQVISSLLDDPSPGARADGLAACREAGIGDRGRALALLRDPAPEVRRAAARTLAVLGEGRELDRALGEALEDQEPLVRAEAAASLRARKTGAEESVRALQTGSAGAQEAALTALEGAGGAARNAVVEWALAKIEEARKVRRWGAALRTAADEPSLSFAFLEDRARELGRSAEGDVLRALTALGSGEALALVGRGLHSNDRGLQAQAVEALETIGEPRLARAFTDLLEGHPDPKARGEGRALEEMAAHPDPWLRAMALRVEAERAQASYDRLRLVVREDPHPIVRMAVHGVFDVGGDRPGEDGKMGETLRTLGTIERVLFLHRVPLFANLTPEDLQAIAEVAGERLFLEGDALCTEGEESDDLFIIVEGRVRVTKQANGASRTLGVREVGEPIGEMGILRRQPRSATVTAEGGSVRTLVMTGRAFESILRERPQVALATLACLAERLSGLV